ncbi:MAG: MFS transporter [Chloroflexi bacterium]|nr:MFS transporter [Chloroflexota bacterium]
MLFQRIKATYNEFPGQFWLMVIGLFISTAGSSMIMPFMMIYASNKLQLPLSTVAALLSINAGTGLLSSFLAGTLADKAGRKLVMNISLTANGLVYFFLLQANNYVQFAVLMFLIGMSNPLYQVGADAMLADLVPSEKRVDAYAINRMINNAGFALGPAIGGFVASRSYALAFYAATAGFLIYSALLFFLARETLVKNKIYSDKKPVPAEADGGYREVFQNKHYVGVISLIATGLIAPSMLWVLLAVYTKTNFGLPENLYGWIPTTNALMCVFVQYSVTRVTRRFPALPVVAIGLLIYSLGVGSVALMSGFWGFWLSMVILTFGELTLVPTATKYVADLAPSNLRGRYMSIYWFGWGASRAIAPVLGGYINDQIAPRAIWIAGLIIGATSGLVLLFLSRRQTESRSVIETEAA